MVIVAQIDKRDIGGIVRRDDHVGVDIRVAVHRENPVDSVERTRFDDIMRASRYDIPRSTERSPAQ